MGLWEVTEEVMSQAERSQSDEAVPSYAHISHRALKDIPKEYTNPYNCKVRALAFNNNHKVRLIFLGNHVIVLSTKSSLESSSSFLRLVEFIEQHVVYLHEVKQTCYAKNTNSTLVQAQSLIDS